MACEGAERRGAVVAIELSFNLPQFNESAFVPEKFDYEWRLHNVKMRSMVEELERLHAALTMDVDDEGISGPVDSFAGRGGDVIPILSDYDTFFLTPAEGNAAYAALSHVHAFNDISDVDLTGAANNDMLYRTAGNWHDTGGLLTWDGSNLDLPTGGKQTFHNAADTVATVIQQVGETLLFDNDTGDSGAGYSFERGPVIVAQFSTSEGIHSGNSNSGMIKGGASSTAAPGITFRSNTGFGLHSAGTQLQVVAGGQAGLTLEESSNEVRATWKLQDNVIASFIQTQGQQTLVGSYVEVGTVANDDDVVTLDNSNQGGGAVHYIINNGANRLQVFPNTGDQIDFLGLNVSVTIEAGDTEMFLSIATSEWIRQRSSFNSLNDVDLTGAADNDMLYRSGGSWIDTGGLLTWDATTFKVWDAGLTDNVSLRHDGNIAHVGGTNVLRMYFEADGDYRFFDTAGTASFRMNILATNQLWENVLAHTSVQWEDGDGNLYYTFGFNGTNGDGFMIARGNDLELRGTTGANKFELFHDNIDANILGTNTTDLNISGFTAIAAGTVDADFDAITGTSYGGVVEADLLDKGVAETITGAYNFTTGGAQIDSNHLLQGYTTGKSVVRSLCLRIHPGTTPGTNFDIQHQTTRGYNEDTVTDAVDMVASTSNGSFTSNVNSRILTYDAGGTVVGILSGEILYADANNSVQDLTLDTFITGGKVGWSLIAAPGSVTQDHVTMTSNVGDFIFIRICYVTST